MGFYADRVLPRVTDLVMSRGEFTAIRARVAVGLGGEVLEIGFGSGLNIPHCPEAVTRFLAVDPATAGRKLAAKRVAASSVPVEYVGLDGQAVQLESASVDHVLTTWTLCTIPDAERALAEIRRVLRPGGGLHFVEHGRSPDPKVARLAGGCRLNRQIDKLVAGAGLELARMDNYYAQGPRPFGYMFEGVAIKP